MNLSSLVRNESLNRVNQVIGILARYGLADWIRTDAHTPDFVQEKLVGPDGENLSHLSAEQRVRMAITELGTTYIKFGQLLSTRADIIGPKLADELASLQASTPADAPEVARRTLEAELGGPVEQFFASFEPEAFRSGSIAQVHFATLPNGREVVVKIQHAGIEAMVREDLKFLKILAGIAEEHSEQLKRFNPSALARLFEFTLMRELDFRIELSNMKTIKANFENDPFLHIPVSYPELSGRTVLTMERLQGYSIVNSERMEFDGVDTRHVATHGATVFLDMIFRDRIYHADPHPGNIFVLPGQRIGLLDFGKVERIDEKTQEDFEELAYAFASGDTLLLTDELMRICAAPPGLNRETVRADIGNLIHEALGKSVNQLDMKAVINGCFEIIRLHGLVLPPKMSMMFMVLIQLEGTSQSLDACFDLSEILKTYQKKSSHRRLAPERLTRRFHRIFLYWEQLFDSFPRDIGTILSRIQEGQLNIKMDVKGLDRPVNRLVYGIIIAALIVASSMLWASRVPPLVYGYSLFGALGSFVSFILGLILLAKISSSGGLD